MKYPQFALELSLSDEPRLENLIVGKNGEVLAHLYDLVAGIFEPMCLYLWGASGAGKTHILRSLAVAEQTRFLTACDFNESVAVGDTCWFLIDDVDGFDAVQQTNLFHLFNAVRSLPADDNRHLIVTASCTPARLPEGYLPDLRTRLSWDLVYQLHVLSDAEKARVLTEQSEQRGLTLGSGVIEYMLRYSSRDLSKLHEFLVHLDTYSLQKKQAVTIPLLKEWLNHSAEV
jgi:DnaA family protein